jgi:hypothetical protein
MSPLDSGKFLLPLTALSGPEHPSHQHRPFSARWHERHAGIAVKELKSKVSSSRLDVSRQDIVIAHGGALMHGLQHKIVGTICVHQFVAPYRTPSPDLDSKSLQPVDGFKLPRHSPG